MYGCLKLTNSAVRYFLTRAGSACLAASSRQWPLNSSASKNGNYKNFKPQLRGKIVIDKHSYTTYMLSDPEVLGLGPHQELIWNDSSKE